jgi:hypothetical protein
VTLVGRRSPERDPGLTKDILQRRDRIVVDLGLLILIRVVVNGDLEHRLVRTLRVSLPAPVLVEERGLKSALGQPGGDERRNVSPVEPIASIRLWWQVRRMIETIRSERELHRMLSKARHAA